MLFKRKQTNYSIMSDMITSKDRLAEESNVDKQAHKLMADSIKRKEQVKEKLWQSQIKEAAKAYRLVLEDCRQTKCSY